VEAAVETRLIDLSAMGARIAHANMLSPGCACVLELPESLGGLALAARVVRTKKSTGHLLRRKCLISCIIVPTLSCRCNGTG
jgi:hypothetical protein